MWGLIVAHLLKHWRGYALAAFAAAAFLALRHHWIKQGREELQQENQQLRAELTQCAKVVQIQTRANEVAIRNAEVAKAKAEAAERRAGVYADRFASQMVTIERSLTKAKRDPACAAILEQKTCAPLF